MRLHARAFVIADDEDSSRVAFVSIDAGMGSDLLNTKVLARLDDLIESNPYTIENLAISGTHTHSGPAGFLQYVLYQFTSLGYVEETMEAFVEGIAQAVLKAHNAVSPNVKINYTKEQNRLDSSNINRSPTSYLLNPDDELALYDSEGDTDKNMLLLKFLSGDNEPLAMLNWFAVHGTSLNNTNKLISGDNKGLASYLFEKHMNGAASNPLSPNFVAAFASTNLGDVSPNTAGPRCLDTGLPCDTVTSTCNGKNEMCVAFGPGTDGDIFESVKIIGTNQYDHAVDLFDNHADSSIQGGVVDYRHSFLTMSNLEVTLEDGSVVSTCSAALGYAFAAGTTDGPGMFDFTQGTNSSSPFWNIVSGFISKPTDEEKECQSPKPILLNTGDVSKPYEWDPKTVPISVFRVGNLFILNAPGELTTMAGRRLRATISQVLIDNGVEDPVVTIAGLTNTYTHYITTYEEYQAQRYEAASTLYGPHTLAGYTQEFVRIVGDMLAGRSSDTDEAPEDMSEEMISFVPPVVADFVGIGHDFGDVHKDAEAEYNASNDVVSVEFLAANPRNNQRIMDTFLTVERKLEGGDDDQYEVAFRDADYCTKFMWKGGVGHAGRSIATVEWDIKESYGGLPDDGTYRVCYFGTRKHAIGKMEEFSGCSSDFKVTSS